MESPALAPSYDDWTDEFVASDSLIGRLYRATEATILELIAPLPPHRRAGLAAFCYRRSHLHGVGLTIAATCEQLTLMQVLGTAVGTVLFTQAQARKVTATRAPGSHRPRITLARINIDVAPQQVVADDPIEDLEEQERELVG
jgi:hypothetical protein